MESTITNDISMSTKSRQDVVFQELNHIVPFIILKCNNFLRFVNIIYSLQDIIKNKWTHKCTY